MNGMITPGIKSEPSINNILTTDGIKIESKIDKIPGKDNIELFINNLLIFKFIEVFTQI